VKYFIVALIAGGIVTIALAFIFTAWLSILYLVLGLILLTSSVFWLQLVVSSFAFHEIKVPDRFSSPKRSYSSARTLRRVRDLRLLQRFFVENVY
jgi:c-di-AMP phosphodiesterase-like protein